MILSILLDMANEGFGDRVLIGSPASGLTASDIYRAAHAGARDIHRANADSVLYLATNGPAFTVALFASTYAGVPFIPLNYRLGSGQLDGLIAHHPNAYALAGDAVAAERLQANGLTSRRTTDWLTASNFHDDLDTGALDIDLPSMDSPAPAVLIYTSGTTSIPKAVVLRHDNLVSYVLKTIEFASAEPDDATLISVPPYHIAAIANVITNLYAGRRTVFLEQFSAEHWLDVARSEGITNALVVPTMLARIMDVDPATRDVPTLRSLAYGGAAMPTRVIEKALHSWPLVDFVNAYGLTETSSTIAVLGPREHREALASTDPKVQLRLGSAGLPVPSIEVQIRGESHAVLPSGTVGRIWVRGEQVSGEYAGSGSVLDSEGYFDTRDDGYLDADGYLFIAGRTDDTIIRGGENIAPAEIEEVLLRHPDVVDVVVVGVPDDEWGQRVEAAAVLRAGSTTESEQLRDYVRTHLRTSKTPDHIEMWAEVPRSETGKLVRRTIAERIANRPK